MTDRTKLQAGWTRMKSGNVLTKYMQQNPGEVKKIDAYVAAIAAGQNPVEPDLKTLFGDGFTDVVAAALVADPLPPPPLPNPCYEAQARQTPVEAEARPMLYQMVSKMMHAARRKGSLLPPTTPFLDDLGRFTNSNVTHEDQFALVVNEDLNFARDLPFCRPMNYVYANWFRDDGNWLSTVANARDSSHKWLVHDGSGNEVFFGSANFANTDKVSYQNDWASRVITNLQADARWRGVWVDDFLMSVDNFGLGYPLYDQDNVLLWSNDADFQASQIAFAANAFAAVKAAGYEVIVNARGNIGAPDEPSRIGTRTKDWMDAYYSYVTGMTVEYYLTNQERSVEWSASNPYDGNYQHSWNEWLTVHDHANSLGIGFYPTNYSLASETRQTRYLRGSFLLNWNGTANGSMMLNGADGTDPWNADVAVDVGWPLSAKQAVGSCWLRHFQYKDVYVNPTLSTQTPNGHTVASLDALYL